MVAEIKQEDEEVLKAKSRELSVKEAGSYSFMDGFGLRYITPFALAIGANSFQIGLLSSLPALLGNFSQIFTSKLMEKYSRKSIVFTGVLLQSIMWLVLIGVGALYFFSGYQNSAGLLVALYTLLILFSTITGPAWSSMMKDMTAGINAGTYFARRSKVAGTVGLISMLIAGFTLDYFEYTYIFLGFAILFFISFLGRLGSALLLLKQYEPKLKHEEKYYFSFIQFVKKMPHNNFGRFVLYTGLMAFAVNFASPFLAVYMLKNLNFTYLQFTIVTMSSAVTALLIVSKWGKFADKFGNLSVLKITGIYVSLIPLLYAASGLLVGFGPLYPFVFLVIVECFSGLAWAGYNLCIGNYIYDAVTRQRIALCVAYFSIIHGIMAFLSATLGGILSSLQISLFGMSAIVIVMILSGLFRFGALFGISKKVKEVREVKELTAKEARDEFRALNPGALFNFLDLKVFKNRPY